MFHKITLPFFIAGTGVLLFYFYPNVFNTFCEQFSLKHFKVWLGSEESDSSSDKENAENKYTESDEHSHRLFSKEELKRYDGTEERFGLYLAVLGEVFNVEKGAQHYKPGGGYSFFTGRDATRAYVTGDFSDGGLTDDVSDLDDSLLLSIEDWLTFYRDEYPSVGTVLGRYYDENGSPTTELHSVLNRIDKARANKWLEDKEKEVFPPCNSEWSKEKGSKVWCTQKSGGIDRNWAGVPRKFFRVGYDPRCVCVRNSGPPSGSPDSTDHQNRGDLDHPSLQEYPSCSSDAVSCMVDHP